MKLSLVQTDIIWTDKSANLAKTEKIIRELSGKTDLVILPEMFTTGFCTNRLDLAEDMKGETVQSLCRWAVKYHLAITGSFIATEEGKFFNRAFFAFPDGSIQTADKRHLFSYGHEDHYFSAGNKRLIVNYKDFNIYVLVCYDLRFPVWSRNVSNEYDLLLYVSNFPLSRMQAWDILLPARAVENQAYVCGLNRVGKDGMNIDYSGHSALYNFKGQKITTFNDYENSVKTVEISKSDLENYRSKYAVWRDADQFRIL